MTGAREAEPGPRTVADVMVTPVVTAGPRTPVAAARRLLERCRIRHLPVVDDGLLVGIVSVRDLARARGDGEPLEAMMTRPVLILSPGTPLTVAARRLSARRVGAMPVVDGRRLVGIVSVVDLLDVDG